MTSPPSTITKANTHCNILSRIPVELLDRILTLTDPETLSAFSRLSRAYHSYVEDNTYVWLSLYIKYFDHPRTDQQRSSLHWKGMVQRRTQALHVANACSASEKDTLSALDALIDVAQTAKPGPSSSQSIAWLEQHIPQTFIWVDVMPEHQHQQPLSQAQAKLQVLRCERQNGSASRLASQMYTYDMRHYRRLSQYGPFIPKRGKGPLEINYVHLWHLMNALFHNIYESHASPGDVALWMSRGFNATRAMTAPPSPVEGDWAGVEGDWVRFICWMDYGDLEGKGDVATYRRLLQFSLFLRVCSRLPPLITQNITYVFI
jgi:hypothetical protein